MWAGLCVVWWWWNQSRKSSSGDSHREHFKRESDEMRKWQIKQQVVNRADLSNPESKFLFFRCALSIRRSEFSLAAAKCLVRRLVVDEADYQRSHFTTKKCRHSILMMTATLVRVAVHQSCCRINEKKRGHRKTLWTRWLNAQFFARLYHLGNWWLYCPFGSPRSCNCPNSKSEHPIMRLLSIIAAYRLLLAPSSCFRGYCARQNNNNALFVMMMMVGEEGDNVKRKPVTSTES